uniref:Uncharacterized protein n=1 Tax=Fagus sylvatica TaxID=28930 RepID=A0A2N9FY67_FAGSY
MANSTNRPQPSSNAFRRSSASLPSSRAFSVPDSVNPHWKPSERVLRMKPEFQVKKKQFFVNFMTIMLFGAIGTLISCAVISLGISVDFYEEGPSCELQCVVVSVLTSCSYAACLYPAVQAYLAGLMFLFKERKGHAERFTISKLRSDPGSLDADSRTKMVKMSQQIQEYEILVKQLKEELREEKLRAKEEAEDLAQEMAEFRYQITGLLEEECRRRASIEQASLQRIAELEAQELRYSR